MNTYAVTKPYSSCAVTKRQSCHQCVDVFFPGHNKLDTCYLLSLSHTHVILGIDIIAVYSVSK